jgi:hypothetical protein
MARQTGRAAVERYFAQLPATIGERILPGAGRAGGKVIAAEAKLGAPEQVKDAIIVQVKRKDGRVVVTITTEKGWAMSLGIWAEWGTDPHFISISDQDRGGLSLRKTNDRVKRGELKINGKFVGNSVFHPGAKAHPFLRPALDMKATEAIAAAQGYINSRVARLQKAGLLPAEAGDE